MFTSLKNHGLSSLIDPMFELGGDTMNLSLEEKMKYWQGNDGGTFGYLSVTRNIEPTISSCVTDTRHWVPLLSTLRAPKTMRRCSTYPSMMQ